MKKKITFHMMFSVFIICTLSCLEKPRDFDPFGHAGLSPLVTI